MTFDSYGLCPHEANAFGARPIWTPPDVGSDLEPDHAILAE
jgi:hypothetical protein